MKTNNQQNRERERKNIEKFLELYLKEEYDPKSKVLNISYRDKPDVIFYLNEKKIGVEETTLNNRESPSEKIENSHKDLLKQLRSDLKDFNLGIAILFDGNAEAIELRKTSKVISEKIKSKLPQSNNTIIIPTDELPRCILGIKTWNELEETQVMKSAISSTMLTSSKMINSIIEEKNSKLENYDKCDEYWLLLVLKDYNLAKQINFHSDFIASSNLMKSDFSKVFILNTTNYVDRLEIIKN